MTEQDKDKSQAGSEGEATRGAQSGTTGDPGRTPGKAEGDERTAEEDLNRQGGGAS